MTSQSTNILNHLQNGNGLTPLEALELFDCLRLSARIFDLKDLGHNIVNLPHKVRSGKTVAKYFLMVEE